MAEELAEAVDDPVLEAADEDACDELAAALVADAAAEVAADGAADAEAALAICACTVALNVPVMPVILYTHTVNKSGKYMVKSEILRTRI